MAGGDQQERLKAAIEALRRQQARIDRLEHALARSRDPIAVVGIGCRLPGGVHGPDTFWRRLREGFDAIGDVPADRWNADAWYDADSDATGTQSTRSGGFLDAIDRFDARFFQISPREAASMDPQQRLLLEVTWHALEHAGIAPHTLVGRAVGVFVGITAVDYARVVYRDDLGSIDTYSATGNVANIAAGRLSYFFGLRGPSVAVDTACSSSLVSLHLACQSLRAGESELAIAAGVNIMATPDNFVALSRAHMLSPDGRCRAFDRSANGYGRGEGCGVLLLKPLSGARAAGDRVIGVILGSAVRQDGHRSGLTVPNGPAQSAVMRAALDAAGVRPREVGYLEAHGTGTSLGDPIEFEALADVYAEGRDPARPLVVGSLKTNVGHMESAAGVGGVIKALLAVAHGEVPPHLHFDEPNPEIDLGQVPATIPVRPLAWPPGYERRIAAISSFGSSGTIAHAIVAAADAIDEAPPAPAAPKYVLPISAKTDRALAQLVKSYRERLAGAADDEVGGICYTAAVGRSPFRFRVAVVGPSATVLADKLASGDIADAGSDPASEIARAYLAGGDVDWRGYYDGATYARVDVPVYPFQGDRHWVERAAHPRPAKRAVPVGAAATRPRFGVMFFNGTEARNGSDSYRMVVDAARFADAHGFSSVWLPERHFTGFGGLYPNPATLHAALARETTSVRLMAGSVVLPLHSPLRIAEEWAVVDNLSGGRAGMSFASGWNPDDFALDPTRFSRRRDELFTGIDTLRRLWRGEGVTAKNGAGSDVELRTYPTPIQRELPLWVTAAGNLETFRRAGEIGANLLTHLLDHDPDELALKIAVYRRARHEHGHDPDAGQVTVMLHTFVGETLDAVHATVREPYCQYLKDNIGLLKGLAAARGSRADIDSLSPDDVDEFVRFLYSRFFSTRALLGTPESCQPLVDRLAAIGVDEIACLLDFGPSTDDVLAQLPRLGAFVAAQSRDRPGPRAPAVEAAVRAEAAAGDLAQSMYEVSWTEVAVPACADAETRSWALLDGADAAALDSADRAAALAASLARSGPRDVVCGWHLDVADERSAGLGASLMRIVRLVQALLRSDAKPLPRLWFLTRGAHVTGRQEGVRPAQRALWGLVKVLPIEHLGLWGGVVNLDAHETVETSAGRVLDVIAHIGREDQVALRGSAVLAARLVSAAPSFERHREWRARHAATYIVTGGFGGIGLSAAQWLRSKGARHLTLVGRTPLPEDDDRIRGLATDGMLVERVALDVADRPAFQRWMAARRDTGATAIAGVIHAAGVWGDCEIASLDETALDRVLAPKVEGTLTLDSVFPPGELDFFVVFSAFSALLPADRQGGYAAANAFADAVVERRRANGDHAFTVNWGLWAGVGFGTTEYGRRAHDRLQSSGIGRIEPPDAWALLDRLIAANRSGVGVMSVDWHRLFEADPNARLSPLLSDLAATWGGAAGAAEARGQLAEAVAGLPSNRQLATIQSALTSIVSGVMHLDRRELAVDAPLTEFGLDSLMAVEIKNRLQHDACVNVPLVQLLEGPSILELATTLLASIKISGLARLTPSPGERLEEIDI